MRGRRRLAPLRSPPTAQRRYRALADADSAGARLAITPSPPDFTKPTVDSPGGLGEAGAREPAPSTPSLPSVEMRGRRRGVGLLRPRREQRYVGPQRDGSGTAWGPAGEFGPCERVRSHAVIRPTSRGAAVHGSPPARSETAYRGRRRPAPLRSPPTAQRRYRALADADGAGARLAITQSPPDFTKPTVDSPGGLETVPHAASMAASVGLISMARA